MHYKYKYFDKMLSNINVKKKYKIFMMRQIRCCASIGVVSLFVKPNISSLTLFLLPRSATFVALTAHCLSKVRNIIFCQFSVHFLLNVLMLSSVKTNWTNRPKAKNFMIIFLMVMMAMSSISPSDLF